MMIFTMTPSQQVDISGVHVLALTFVTPTHTTLPHLFVNLDTH